MTRIAMLTMLAVAHLVLFAPAARAYEALTCEELWYERNSIYKQAGYCFRTSRGIRAFGNAGCQFDDVNDVPLSARQRSAVAEIQGIERRRRCPT
jgi:hypothetical protein